MYNQGKSYEIVGKKNQKKCIIHNNLTNLNLASSFIRPADLQSLANYIEKMQSLEILNLANSRFEGIGSQMFFKELAKSNIKELCLKHSEFAGSAISDLLTFVKTSKTIQFLDLLYCKIGEIQKELASLVNHNSLKTILLSNAQTILEWISIIVKVKERLTSSCVMGRIADSIIGILIVYIFGMKMAES